MPQEVCEVCGKRAERTFRVSVEGSEVSVCPSCLEKLGRRARLVEEKTEKRAQTAQAVQAKPRPARSRALESLDVVENYSELVKRERERRGWTQEMLAQKLRVSVDVVRKIESGKYKPPIDLARRIESVLKLKLLVSTEEEPLEEAPRFRGATLGEVVVVRREEE